MRSETNRPDGDHHEIARPDDPRHHHRPGRPRPTCVACGKTALQEDLVSTSVGYKCPECAKPVAKLRRPFKHPVLQTLLAEDGLTFVSRPLSLALAAGMLVGVAGRGIAIATPLAAVLAAAILGFVIGEVTRLGARDRLSRVHGGVAVAGVVAAAAVANLALAPMALSAVVAIGMLLVPAESGR